MFHEIQLGDKKTYTDWGLLPVQQPTFNPPAVKSKILDIPGGNGIIDLTEAIAGYPVYDNREGTWSFLVPDGSRKFLVVYSKLMEYLHGQPMRAMLPDDDPGWYYEGRFWVDSMASNQLKSLIAISYSVGPYKWKVTTTTEPWLWDPFSFVDGVIDNGVYVDTSVAPPAIYIGSGAFTGIPITTTPLKLAFYPDDEDGPHSGLWRKSSVGAAPLQVGFTVSTGATLTVLRNESLIGLAGLTTNTVVDGLVLYHGVWLYNGWPADIYVATDSGTGTLSMIFREGRM